MKFMVLLLVLLGYVVIAKSSLDELPVHPGVGGLYKGPNFETIIKGPDGSVITAKEEGGSIETQAPLEPIVAAEAVNVEPLVPVVPVVNVDVASATIDSTLSVSTGETSAAVIPAVAPVVAPVVAPIVHKVEIVQQDPHIIETEIVDAPIIEPQQSSDLIGPSGSISTRGSSAIISGPASTTILEPAKVLVATPLVAAVPVIASVKSPLVAVPNANIVSEVSVATATASPLGVVSLQPAIATVTSAPPINTASISPAPQWTGSTIAPSTNLSPSIAPQWSASTIAPPTDLSPSISPQWSVSTIVPPTELSPSITPQWSASTIAPPSDLSPNFRPQWAVSTIAPPRNFENIAVSTPQAVSTIAPPTSWQPVRNSPAPLNFKHTRINSKLSITTPSPGGVSLYRQETVFGEPQFAAANPTINLVDHSNSRIPNDESIVSPVSSYGIINNVGNIAQISSTVRPDLFLSTVSPPTVPSDLGNIHAYGTTNSIDNSVQISSTIRPDFLVSTINPSSLLTGETLSQDVSRIDSNQVALNNRQLGINPSLIPSANIIPPEIGPLPKGAVNLGSTVTAASISRNRGVISSTELPNIQRTEDVDNIITDNSLRNLEGSYSLDIQVGTDGRLGQPIHNQILTSNSGRNIELLTNTNPIDRIPQEGLVGSELTKQGVDPSEISLTNVPLSSVTRLAPIESPYSVSEIVEDTSRSLWNRYGRMADPEESEKKEK